MDRFSLENVCAMQVTKVIMAHSVTVRVSTSQKVYQKVLVGLNQRIKLVYVLLCVP